MLDADANRRCLARASADADVALIEGVMGLFDGSEGSSERGSSAEAAKLLGVPVVLVIDAGAMARSAAALIHGFAGFDPELRIAGVILNKVGGEGHAQVIRAAVAGEVPILGAIPRVPEVVIAERHLGLRLPHEARADLIHRLGALVEERIDLDALLASCRIERGQAPPVIAHRPLRVRLGVACDEAFCFYYAENLELLEQAGAQLVPFSPLADALPGGLDGLYLGGGYPELHAARLSANHTVREAIRGFCDRGGPIYAECGGLIYLGQSIELDGSRHELCGALPLRTRMPGPLSIGYAEIMTTGGLFGAGRIARGHVFHGTEIIGEPPGDRFYVARSAHGERRTEGFAWRNILASYIHLHFGSAPELATAFVDRCAQAAP